MRSNEEPVAGQPVAGQSVASGSSYPPPQAPGQAPPYREGAYAPGPGAFRYGGGLATAALILGILAVITSVTVVLGVVLGILALIFGLRAAGRAKRGEAPGRGRAVAGYVLGIVGVLLAVALIAAGATLFNSKSGKDFRSCLNAAGTNPAQIQHCDTQFRRHSGL